MSKYRVVFIDKDHKPKRAVIISAFNKNEAYVKAETLYKVNDWKWNYNDLYADFLG